MEGMEADLIQLEQNQKKKGGSHAHCILNFDATQKSRLKIRTREVVLTSSEDRRSFETRSCTRIRLFSPPQRTGVVLKPDLAPGFVQIMPGFICELTSDLPINVNHAQLEKNRRDLGQLAAVLRKTVSY